MTQFSRRRADNPVNPGQVFPLEAARRSKLLKAQRLTKKLEGLVPREGDTIDRPMVDNIKDFLDNEKILELSREGRGEPITSRNLYRQQWVPIIQNLVRKKEAGTYNSDAAVLLFTYLVESARKAQGYSPLGRGTKIEIARSLRDNFEKEYANGAYEKYVPKKYQKRIPSGDKRIVLRHISKIPGSTDRKYEADVVTGGRVEEKLTGILFSDQGLNDQLQHHATLRGHGLRPVYGTENVPPFGSEAKSYKETHPDAVEEK